MTVLPFKSKTLFQVAGTAMLNGQTVLIVEEEFLIALDIQRVLEGFNAKQAVFARSVPEAMRLHARWPEFGLAIVDVRNQQDGDLQLVRGLHDAGVNLVISTADSALRRGLPGLPGVPVLTKPVPEEDLANAIKRALAK